MPAGRQGISKAGRSTQGKVRGLRTGASFPENIMAARRDRVAQASKALGKGSKMAKLEITFSQNVDYSLVLNDTKKRELADHLDITVKELNSLVDKGMLYELHDSQLVDWIEDQRKAWDELDKSEIEIDQITAG